MKSIRITLPEFPYIRCLYYAFLKLIDPYKANIRVVNNAVELEAKGDDIREVLSSAIDYAVELGNDYKQRNNLKSSFPLSGKNDEGIFTKLKVELGLSKDDDMLTALNKYSSKIKEIDDIQSAFNDNNKDNTYSPLQAFLLETYSLTRAPFFNSNYNHDLKMNLHQMMICAAGYIAARHSMYIVMKGKDKRRLTVLFLPLNLKVTKYDFYKAIREVPTFPGLSPEEAVILWIVLHLPEDFYEDILVLGVEEPGQSMQRQSMQPVSSITVSSEFLRRAERLKMLRDQSKPKPEVKELLEYALKKGITTKPQPEIDDAIEYVKLLYLAVQEGYEREILELALRSSRRETLLASTSRQDNAIRNRLNVARKARTVSKILLKEFGLIGWSIIDAQ